MSSTLRFPTAPRFLAALLLLFVLGDGVRAELVDVQFYRREPFAGGMSFGDTGPYEKIVGVARFAVDPDHPRNRIIRDLKLAPRNKDGKVEFACDVFILAPKDPSKGNGAILYDVNNRGNKLALGFFNYAAGSNDPTTPAHAGDGFLFRRGYTVVWCGWIGELLPGNNRLLLQAPIATENGKPIRGTVTYEFGTEDPKAESLPLSRREGHGSYNPTERGEREGVLTWRMREGDERVVIARELWSLVRIPPERVKDGVPGTLSQVRIKVAGGFRPGYLYELICEAEGSIVQGTGLAAVRDLVSFLKYDGAGKNPLAKDGKSAVTRAHGFGVSQSGRFLRHFLYQGFNVDEKSRKVFDGLMPHVAGGGLGFFNHRFAQPTRHNAQHEEHSYPADAFPFTYGASSHKYLPFPGGKVFDAEEEDGIQTRTASLGKQFLPKVMHTQSAAEYWHRSGSLVHTDPVGGVDAEIPANVRIYAFGGTQHGPSSDPPKPGIGDNLPNPGNYKPFQRALLDALDAWVKEDAEPPPSVYPKISDGTLVDWHQKATGFPSLPGVRYPEVIQRPSYLDYGPDFEEKGIITKNPPRMIARYVVKVPKSGPDGNDLGTLLPPEVRVPLATYTGWNLRGRAVGAEAQLWSLMGSYIPFSKTAAERKRKGDPRPSIEERYGSFAEYEKQFRAGCADYVKRRYLLKEDADRLLAGRAKLKGLFPGGDPGTERKK